MDGPQGPAASSSSPGWVKPETGTAGSGAPSPQQQPPHQQHSAGSQQGHGLAPDIFSLDFDDLVFGSGLALDVPTLNAVCAIEGGCNGKGSSSRHRQRSNKRPEPEPGSSDSDDDDDDDGGTAGGAGLKRSKSELSQAATRKASREKARRTKLNERFADLAKLIDPGNEPKTDKTTILSDAVRYVQQLHVENHQLKQLNKFLEERVAQYERDRGQQLYQQSLMLQQQQQQGMMGGPPGMMQQGMMGGPGPSMMQHPPLMSGPAGLGMHPHLAGSSSMGGGVGMHSLGSGSSLGMPVHSLGQQQQQSQSGSQAGPSSGPLGGGMALQSHHGLHPLPVPGTLPPGLQTQPPQQQQQQSIGHGGGSGSLEAKPMVLGHLAQPVAPGGYWLPNTMHDSTQDSLLRPPAA